jgi:choline dehydrogenase-like flavoprotein
VAEALGGLLKGSLGPVNNDSRYLLNVHSRALPGEKTMRRYPESAEVDLVIVGAGAGGSVLAQRLARAGWQIVILEAGPFWHPDEDWVSDEAGSHELYWTQQRIIGYEDLLAHYERVEAELPVAGQDWPRGYPHRYPFSPHPISAAAEKLVHGALALGIEMRVGPVGIVNGTFGNRPHCIYQEYCLQGCKVNAKASPYVTHLPDALAHGVEIRANCMALRVELDEASGLARGVTFVREGEPRHRIQRARFVAVADYSIETPRLLLASTSARHPNAYATTRISSGVTSWCRAPARPRAAGPRSCGCTRRRRQRCPRSSFMCPTGRSAPPRAARTRP